MCARQWFVSNKQNSRSRNVGEQATWQLERQQDTPLDTVIWSSIVNVDIRSQSGGFRKDEL